MRGISLRRSRIFPLRPCHYEFSLQKPLDPKKIKACLYYHTRQCPAPCAGRISPQAYRKLAQEAALFLGGQFSRLAKTFRREMAHCCRRLHFEEAAEFRDRLKALEHLQERVQVHAIAEKGLQERLEGSRAVTALQKALGLETPPVHIEAADISHLFGKETVGSFVCFMGGQPHTDHYRRFRVRTVTASDDYAGMREVVGRRLRGLRSAGSPLPDLLLVDGGKGQLSAALEAMEMQRARVPAAGLAKQEEEIFLPQKQQPLRLDRADPALRLLQWVRDEAHRFALSYHRLLRKKGLFSQK